MKRVSPRHTLGGFALCLMLSGCLGAQSPAPVSVYGTTKGAGSAGVHTVSGGETLWNISQRYNISMQDIVVGNDLSAPFVLDVGQRLKLPPPREYRVRSGDTLYEVSRLFGVSSTDVARQNDLREPYVLRTGQVLRMPSVSKKVAAEPVRSASVVRPGVKPQQPVQQNAQVAQSEGGMVKPGKKPAAPGSSRVASYEEPRTAPVRHEKITAKTPKRSSSKFLRPVNGSIISEYGPKPNGLHNDGVNIRAAKGTAVSAAENGVVVYAGSELKGSGNLVLVRHDNRWMTAYAHLDNINVKRGAVIKRGQKIGTVGNTGSVDSPQLHFEVRRGTEAINPKLYLDG